MPAFSKFEEIKAWQQAREVVRAVYRVTADGAAQRDFAWRDQLRRAAMSIMANIAEGFGRNSDKDFAHFLDIARSSCLETQSFLYIGLDQAYIDKSAFTQMYELIEETISMTASLTSYLRKSMCEASSGASAPRSSDSRRQTPDSRPAGQSASTGSNRSTR